MSSVHTVGEPQQSNFVLKNYGQSPSQIRMAAESGNPDAEYALGYMYYYGDGLPRNAAAGRSWIQKAAAQGQPLAIRALNIMHGAEHPSAGASGSRQQLALDHPTTRYRQQVSQNASDNQVGYNAAPRSTAAPRSPLAMAQPAAPRAKPKPVVRTQESTILRMPASNYTIQLFGVRSQAELRGFLSRHNLNGKAYAYHTKYQGKSWYVLVYGNYSSLDAAHSAIAQLPSSLQQLKPWVKSVSSVQQAIRHGS